MSPRSNEQNEAQRAQTRALILQTALKAFAEKGYSAASISYIAKEAGISKGLTYHYFENKEALLFGIFEMLAGMADGIEAQWEGKNAKEKLLTTIEMTFQFFDQQPDTVRFMTALALQPEVTASIKEILMKQKAMNIEVYEALFAELGFSQPKLEAFAFGALLDGVALGSLALEQEYPLEEMKTMILTKYDL